VNIFDLHISQAVTLKQKNKKIRKNYDNFFFTRVDLMWNNSKIDFLLFLNKCDISPRNVLFSEYEIPIKLKGIIDNRIKNLITSKQKNRTS
jgi:hypothetical protein